VCDFSSLQYRQPRPSLSRAKYRNTFTGRTSNGLSTTVEGALDTDDAEEVEADELKLALPVDVDVALTVDAVDEEEGVNGLGAAT